MNASSLMRRSLPATAALLLLAAPGLAAEPAAADEGENVQQQLEEAQKRLDETVREVERLSSRLGALRSGSWQAPPGRSRA